LLIASILVVQLILYWCVSSQPRQRRGVQVASPVAGYGVRPARERNSGRPVYPFSVIRGGAFNAAELEAALDSDPVAAKHYAGFRRARLHTVELKDERRAYVSFRVGGSVFWTRRPVGLIKGETLLTDGELYARARCGNRISSIPQEPTAAKEPTPALLDVPEVSSVPASALVAEIFPPFDLLPAATWTPGAPAAPNAAPPLRGFAPWIGSWGAPGLDPSNFFGPAALLPPNPSPPGAGSGGIHGLVVPPPVKVPCLSGYRLCPAAGPAPIPLLPPTPKPAETPEPLPLLLIVPAVGVMAALRARRRV